MKSENVRNAAFLGVKNKSTARKPFVSAALRTAQVPLTSPALTSVDPSSCEPRPGLCPEARCFCRRASEGALPARRSCQSATGGGDGGDSRYRGQHLGPTRQRLVFGDQLPVSASKALICLSISARRCLSCRFTSGWRAWCCWSSTAMRSRTSSSRPVRSSSRSPRAHGVHARQRQLASQRLLERPVPRPRGRVHHPVRRAGPRRQLLESRRVVREPRRSPGGQRVGIEMRLRNVDANRARGMIAHAFLAPVLVMRASMLMYPFRTFGKDGGDQTRSRSLTARTCDGPTSAPRRASVEASRVDPAEGPRPGN